MRPRDLARRHLVVVADIRRRVSAPMLKLDLESDPELLDVKSGPIPVDSDPLADLASPVS